MKLLSSYFIFEEVAVYLSSLLVLERDLDLITTLRECDLVENLSHSPHCLKSHLLLDKNMKHVYF